MKRSQFGPATGDPRSQVAALCWRMHRDRVEVLLITSRDTGRWVLPKGWPMEGRDAADAAVQEAWEEAGVTGVVNPDVLGLFGYDKVMGPKAALPCMVSVFGLRVAALARRFPERKERRRKWFSAEAAARKVAEPELRSLLKAVAKGQLRLTPEEARD
jgi:8-oxo-dGTP pyrophosphatase MutT (NUDIX family)